MPRASYSAEKNRIQKEIEKLEKKMQQLKSKERKPVITSIVKSMREYDISLEELAAVYNRKASARATTRPRATSTSAPTKRVVPPKYQDPATGATWTGRGRAPRWIADAEARGESREAYLIKKPTAATPAA